MAVLQNGPPFCSHLCGKLGAISLRNLLCYIYILHYMTLYLQEGGLAERREGRRFSKGGERQAEEGRWEKKRTEKKTDEGRVGVRKGRREEEREERREGREGEGEG